MTLRFHRVLDAGGDQSALQDFTLVIINLELGNPEVCDKDVSHQYV